MWCEFQTVLNTSPVVCYLGKQKTAPQDPRFLLTAKESGVSDEQFEEAWNDATRIKLYSARAIGKCDLLNDDAGNVSVSTPEDRRRLETQLKLERQGKPTSPTSFSAIQLDGGSFAPAVKHVLIPEKGQLEVIYK
jgi:hypothetical protein